MMGERTLKELMADIDGAYAERDRLKAINAELLAALILWQASDQETNEGARQVARQIAREKRDAAIARAESSE